MYTVHYCAENDKYYLRYTDKNYEQLKKQIKRLQAWLARPLTRDPELLRKKKETMARLLRERDAKIHYVPIRETEIPAGIKVRPLYGVPARTSIPRPSVCVHIRQNFRARWYRQERDPGKQYTHI